MKLSVLTNLFGDLSLEQALDKFEKLGIECVEIGCGGFPGKAHCDPEVLLADEAALDEFLDTVKRHGMDISALSVHGNPVHPDKAIADSFHKDFVNAVLLAEKLGVDTVITFEELQALLDSKDIDITTLPEQDIDDASYYGRIFARSCGLSEAVAEGLKERGIDGFDLRAVPCDGIEACRVALLKASKKILDGNFIEGMACVNGCVGGAGCLTHGEINKLKIDKHGRLSMHPEISHAVNAMDKDKK